MTEQLIGSGIQSLYLLTNLLVMVSSNSYLLGLWVMRSFSGHKWVMGSGAKGVRMSCFLTIGHRSQARTQLHTQSLALIGWLWTREPVSRQLS